MNRKNQIDEVFRGKLENAEVTPPEYLWTDITARLDSRDRKIGVLWIKRGAVAAALVLAFLAGWELQLLHREGTGKNSSFAEKTLEKNKKARCSSVYSYRSSDLTVAETNFPENKKEIGLRKKYPLVKSLTVRKTASSEKKYLTATALQTVSDKIHSNTRLIALPFSKMGNPELAVCDLKTEDGTSCATSIDDIIIARNLEINHSENKKKLIWSVGAQMASSNSLNSPQPTVESALNSSSNDLVPPSTRTGNLKVNFGTGLTLAVQTSRRLSFQTGLFYSKLQQGSTGTYEQENIARPMLLETSNFSNSRKSWIVDTPWGVGRVNHRAMRVAQNPHENLLYASAMATEGADFNQQAQYMEIPLLLRYKLLDHRLGLDLLGGMGANFLVGNDLYEVDGGEKRKIGETTDMNGFTYSSIFGLGLSYGLSSKIKLSLEPKMKYYLNSLSSNRSVNLTPWIFGVYAGLNFNF